MSGRSCRGGQQTRFKVSVLPDAPLQFMFPCVVFFVQTAVPTSQNSNAHVLCTCRP